MCQCITLDYACEYFQMCNPWLAAAASSLPGISEPEAHSGAWAASKITVPGLVEEQVGDGAVR